MSPFRSERTLQGDWPGVSAPTATSSAASPAPTTDLVGLPAGVSYTVEQGARYNWTQLAGNIRALESPDQSQRQASGWFHATQTRVRVNFTGAYSGTLHLYTVDPHWLAPGRRENVTVDDGAGPRTAFLATDFSNGAGRHTSRSPSKPAARWSSRSTGSLATTASSSVSSWAGGDAAPTTTDTIYHRPARGPGRLGPACSAPTATSSAAGRRDH